MAEISREIYLKGFDPICLLGTNDGNIRLLNEHFQSNITSRGELIIIKGENREVDHIQTILSELIQLIPKKKYLDKTDVRTMIKIETPNDETPYSSPDDSIILFTKDGMIKPRTAGQEAYYRTCLVNDIVFALGPAGTGKTYQAIAIAISALKNREIARIILSRPAVEAGEKLGFLPGDLREKIDPYLAPLYDAMEDMLSADKLKHYLEQKIIEIIPLAYMRGRTLSNSYLILDEAQNATSLQMKMFLTRIGISSKAIITGDQTQVDLGPRETSGLTEAVNILTGIDGIGISILDETDVVRHRLVKDIIRAYSNKEK
ncbi:MAG: PhoH family protein [Candidatus Marinimicrobia bacterium]|nr:PhoH family protein [Candidatus Neomarinimicrobiota bacterium]